MLAHFLKSALPAGQPWPSRAESEMTASESKSEQLIEDYLRELRVSAWNRQLPRSQTTALEAEVRLDIRAALEEAGNRDEATVYRVLDRLGAPGDIVAKVTARPRSDVERAVDFGLAPILRVHAAFRSRGWGLAEVGALVLLLLGPFLLWWIGPIFGIILVRVAADRWSHRATHRATNFVVGVFAVQVLIAVGLLVYVLTLGGPFDVEISKVFSSFSPGRWGLSPLSPFLGGAGPLSPLQILLVSPPFVAGIASGIYLALSPRQRARPMT
jgi:hypothetical protein